MGIYVKSALVVATSMVLFACGTQETRTQSVMDDTPLTAEEVQSAFIGNIFRVDLKVSSHPGRYTTTIKNDRELVKHSRGVADVPFTLNDNQICYTKTGCQTLFRNGDDLVAIGVESGKIHAIYSPNWAIFIHKNPAIAGFLIYQKSLL